jgi:mono/diheme cytochrome c family protein
MKRFLCLSALVALTASLSLLRDRAAGQTPAAAASDLNRAMLNTYCVGCHNARLKTGGLVLEGLSTQQVAADAAVWEKVLKKLRGRLMPPPGLPQPPQKDIDAFTASMENALDKQATQAKGPTAGYVPIQRLNRTEYAASVKALIGVDVDEKEILPQDIQVEGFDNIAEALRTSPAFLDQYLTAARHLAKAGVGNMAPPISSVTFQTEGNQDPALPFPAGMRGGVKFTHSVPADGEYRFSFFDLDIGLYNRQMQNSTTLVLLIDGKPVFKGDLGGEHDLWLANVKGTDGWQQILDRFQHIPIKLLAGEHEIMAGFIQRSHVESDDNVGAGGGVGGAVPMAGFRRGIDILEIKGPYNPTGITNSQTRPMIFVCDPKTSAKGDGSVLRGSEKIGELPCARQIAQNLAHRAYSRPVNEADMAYLMRFYNEGRLDNQPFDSGVEEIVAGVLASPDFLYRSIRGPGFVPGKPAVRTSEFALTDLELARRLSFFLWDTPPDAELLKLAESNGLTKPGVINAQVKRMLADPKASSLVSGFAMKWLNLNSLDSVHPDAKIFQGFNATLRGDFLKEAELFLSSILLEGSAQAEGSVVREGKDKSVLDLLTSDQTFMNNRLARHYGIQNGPSTSAFKEVTLTDPNRFGLLGKAAVLMRTSYGDRTSPVLRGAWVLDKLTGTPPTPPPPTVNTNLDEKPGEAPRTVRARLEQHRDNPTCKMCHGVIDPTGLALENFDAIGRFRQTDAQANNTPIDASTVLANGTKINGPVELREELASHPEAFVESLTEKLLIYAVNRRLEYFDMPQVRKIARDAKKDNYTFASLVLGIVNTDAFRKQGLPGKTAPKLSAQSTNAAAPRIGSN